MNYRELGRTGWKVSEVSFGAWAIGGSWGNVDDAESLAALYTAIDCGVNFIDTADVYGMGRSERLIAQLKRDRKSEIFVATKAGRRLSPHTADGYNERNLTGFIEDSLRNLATDCLDLVQLHCPPTDVYYRPELFGALDRLVEAGKLRYYGVSVERVEEALKAIEFPNVQSVQIIFNCFRHRPAELFFAQAKARRVGILARVPLASGMLSGKLTAGSQFAADDHRQFNSYSITPAAGIGIKAAPDDGRSMRRCVERYPYSVSTLRRYGDSLCALETAGSRPRFAICLFQFRLHAAGARHRKDKRPVV